MSAGTVTLELVAGHSGRNEWTFAAGSSRSVLRIGSGEHCNWNVEGEGVATNHLMLIWDGRQLTAVATGVEARIDGVLLQSSEVLVSCRIEFGAAAIVVRSSGAPVIAGRAEPLAPASRARGARSRPMRAASSAAPRAREELETAVALPQPPAPDTDFATVISGPPTGMSGVAAPTHLAPSSPGAPYGASPSVADATRTVAADAPRGKGRSRRRSAVIGNPDGVSPPAPVDPSYDPDATNYAPPAPALPASENEDRETSEAPTPARFAEPPAPDTDPRRDEAVATRRSASLPPRTWALIGVTFAAALLLLFVDSSSETSAIARPEKVVAAADPGSVNDADADGQPDSPSQSGVPSGKPTKSRAKQRTAVTPSLSMKSKSLSNPSGVARGGVAVPEAARPAALAVVDACAGEARPASKRGRGRRAVRSCPTDASVAADLVAAGRYREALPVYEFLAARAAREDDRGYATMVEVLRRKLADGGAP